MQTRCQVARRTSTPGSRRLGGITLSNQPVPSDFPKTKTSLEKLPCTSKADVAQAEAYIHQQINKLQLTHKVKIDYGLTPNAVPPPERPPLPESRSR